MLIFRESICNNAMKDEMEEGQIAESLFQIHHNDEQRNIFMFVQKGVERLL